MKDVCWLERSQKLLDQHIQINNLRVKKLSDMNFRKKKICQVVYG